MKLLLSFINTRGNKKQSQSWCRGFTLIELLVAIAIITVLSSLVLTNYKISQMKARDAQRINDMKQMQTALEMYYNYNKSYPEESHSGCYDGWETSCDVEGNFIDALRTAGTIAKVPFDPLNNSTYFYAYYNYPAGSNTCTFPHAVLAIHKFESSQNPNIGISAKCPHVITNDERNWYPEFDYSILLPQ